MSLGVEEFRSCDGKIKNRRDRTWSVRYLLPVSIQTLNCENLPLLLVQIRMKKMDLNTSLRRSIIPASVLMFVSAGMSSCNQTAVPQNPNVVLIHIDDLGWMDVGFMGSEYYETPNIDRLASQGLVFTNAYAGAANCAPSRACLLTGQNTPRHGIYTVNPADRGNPRTRQIIASANADSINPSDRTLAHLFGDAGYASIAIGKWHLSSNPVNKDFDYNIGGDSRGDPGHDGYFAPYNIANIEQGPDGEYLPDRLTNEAISFIEKYQHQPFFLYMSYYTVNTPLQAKEDVIEKYRQKGGVGCQQHPAFAAMVELMDENVGRMISRIDELGLTDNTLVVFISDNGGIRAISCQDPLRAGKGSYYEGGLRMPMIMKWSGQITPGTTDAPVVNLDFYPTFMRVLESPSEDKILDGVDLSPLFSGGTLHERPLFWHFPIYLQHYNPRLDQGRDPLFRTRPGTVMRYGKWKLHEYFEDGALELYDLDADLGETNNLADVLPEETAELHLRMIDWRTRTNAPVPTERNPDYDPDFERRQIRDRLSE